MGLVDCLVGVRATSLVHQNRIRLNARRSALIGAPIAAYVIALSHLQHNDEDDDKDVDDDDRFFRDRRDAFDRYWKARLISLGVWLALMVLVFVPMHLWKRSVSLVLPHKRVCGCI